MVDSNLLLRSLSLFPSLLHFHLSSCVCLFFNFREALDLLDSNQLFIISRSVGQSETERNDIFVKMNLDTVKMTEYRCVLLARADVAVKEVW